MISEIRAVTIVTGHLRAARDLYEGQLGMRVAAAWRGEAGDPAAEGLRQLWALPSEASLDVVCLAQPGAESGGIRLVALAPGVEARIVDGARPWDHGYLKNLDVFTDDVEGAYGRLRTAGYAFLSPPVTYPVPWGPGQTATEAHLPTDDGVKISLARMSRAPRSAFGDASADAPFTEVAAATQIVRDYDRAVAFYGDVFECIPAAPTAVEDPGLASALRLPPGTRLRMAFIGPERAVGGKVGLVAYEGPGVADARALAAAAPAGARGAHAITFETDDVDGRVRRARLHGAALIAAPAERMVPPYGTVRAASVRSPDGVLIELFERPSAVPFVPLMPEDRLPQPGGMTAAAAPGAGRVLVARVGEEVFGLEDRCPHLGGPLSRGVLEGRSVTCPWHGWRIDVTSGRVEGGGAARARPCALRREGGVVFVRTRPGGAESA